MRSKRIIYSLIREQVNFGPGSDTSNVVDMLALIMLGRSVRSVEVEKQQLEGGPVAVQLDPTTEERVPHTPILIDGRNLYSAYQTKGAGLQ